MFRGFKTSILPGRQERCWFEATVSTVRRPRRGPPEESPHPPGRPLVPITPPPHGGLARPENPDIFLIRKVFIIFKCNSGGMNVPNLASVTHEPSAGKRCRDLNEAELSKDRGGFL